MIKYDIVQQCMVMQSPAPAYPPSTPLSPGGKRVVVKPLSFTAPPVALVQGGTPSAPLAGSPSQTSQGNTTVWSMDLIGLFCVAASSRLAELASQLTPAQAQTIDHLLHSVKQFSPHIPTTLHSAQVLYRFSQCLDPVKM